MRPRAAAQLETIHPGAMNAARAAECSRGESKFWEMHELLFKNRTRLDDSSVASYAEEVGIPRATFEPCLAEISPVLERQIAEARRLGVNSTPTFFLGEIKANGEVAIQRRVHGAGPYETFRDTVNELLGARP